MNKIKMMIVTCALATLFNIGWAATTPAPITFYNNTDLTVQINETIFMGQIIDCTGNPMNLCLQQQPPLSLKPHSSGVMELVTAVNTPHIYTGAVGFQISTDSSSINTVLVAVEATPIAALIDTDFGTTGGMDFNANSQTETYANNALPKYTASLVQNGSNSGLVATATAISINPLQ